MKLIYILGLEHSGTTLTDQLLSSNEGVVGLGEVANYFSESHMAQYHKRWGHLPDAYLCSCGELLDECEFWKRLVTHSGLVVDEKRTENREKYLALLETAKSLYGDDVVLVDSSKSIRGLQNWLVNLSYLGMSKDDVRVVFVAKDSRGFVASMQKKATSSMNVLDVYRSFNYWSGANGELLNFLNENDLDYEICLYEELCTTPQDVLVRVLNGIVDANSVMCDVSHNQSHIAIGNKNFIMRNRSSIKYDDRWKSIRTIQLMYHANLRAKKLNREIYEKVNFSHRLL